MRLIVYIIREYKLCKKQNKDWKKNDIYKGLKMYKSALNSNYRRGCKSIITVYRECSKLANYWHCFPDTYFRFGMFMKDFGDMDLMKSFIPQVSYRQYAYDKNSDYHILIDDKNLCHDILKMYDLPVPERYFAFQDHTFRQDGRIITDVEVNKIIDNMTGDRIYIKRFRGGAASGVFAVERQDDGYYTKEGNKLSASMIREKFSDSNYIFEKQLVQDSVLAKLNPDTVNTCRVLTYKDKVVSCSIRVGRKGAFVDNAAKGGIVLSLDMETGKIEEYGLREYDLTKYYEHPDTKIRFKDYDVPMWPAVKELVEKTISVLPYYNSVGFDVATTIDGPVIIEINNGTGVYASQMGKKRGIADKFKE